MFSIKLSTADSPGTPLHKLVTGLQTIESRLKNRIKITPEELTRRMTIREEEHNKAPFTPSEDTTILYPGTFYLVAIDNERRRTYKRRPNNIV